MLLVPDLTKPEQTNNGDLDLMWYERKHGLSTEQFPVSAYVGTSKNLKALKDWRITRTKQKGNQVTMSEQRILCTKLLGEAWEELASTWNFCDIAVKLENVIRIDEDRTSRISRF